MPVNYQPEGYHSVNPYLIVHDGAAAIEFYKKAFGAREVMRFTDPRGRIGHAEITIGDSRVCLADEHPEMDIKGPKTIGATPVSFLVYVPDVDRSFDQAIAAGAKVKRAVADQFYGDRVGGVEDPYGHLWYLATHKEDVSQEEMERRAAAMAPAK